MTTLRVKRWLLLFAIAWLVLAIVGVVVGAPLWTIAADGFTAAFLIFVASRLRA